MQENHDNTKTKNVYLKILSVLFGLLFWISTGIITILITLIIALQIPSLRGVIIHQALNIVNSNLLARIEVRDIDFSSFPNLKVLDARLIAAGDTLAYAPKIYVEPNLKELIAGNIDLRNIFLQSPNIKLLRGMDGAWNFEKIAPPAPPDTTEAGDLYLNLGELLIDNAKFDLIDSLSLKQRNYNIDKNKFNFDKLQLRDLSLKLSADFHTKFLTGKFNIKHLQSYDLVTGFTLNNLKIDAELKENSIAINKLHFITPHTNLKLKLIADDLALSKPINIDVINKAKLKLEIFPSTAYIDDIEHIAPTTLRRDLLVDISAYFHGNLKELTIDRLNAKPGNSEINISGKLYDITNPKIRYQGNIHNSKVYKADVNKVLTPNIANAIPDFNLLNIENLYYDGTTTTLIAKINAQSDLGNLSGTMNLVYFPIFKYDAKINFQHLDFAKILKDPSLASRLNGNLQVKGSDVDYKKLSANLDLNLYDSKFMDYAVDTLNLNTEIKSAKLDIHKLHVQLPRDYHSEFIRSFYKTAPVVDITGNLDYKDLSDPKYDLNIKTNGLNLASIMNNPQSIEYLSTNLHLSGEGLNTKSIILRGEGSVDDLIYQDKAAMPFGIKLFIDTKNKDNKTINFFSEIANIEMNGDFDIASLLVFGGHQAKIWSNFISNKMEKVKNPAYQAVYFNEPMLPATFNIHADINDLSLLNLFLDGQEIYSNLELSLRADINEKSAFVSIDTINVAKFQYQSEGTKINVFDIQMSAAMQVNSDSTNYFLDSLFINLPQNGLVVFNDMKIIEPYFQVIMDEDDIEYKLSINLDNAMQISNDAKIDFNDKYMALASNKLDFKYKDALNVSNSGNIDIRYLDGNIHVERFNIQDVYGSKIALQGDLIDGAFSKMQIKVSDMKFSTIDTLLQKFTQVKINDIKGGIDSLTIIANGKLSDPRYNVSLATSDIYIKREKVGKVNLNLEYFKKNLFGAGKISEASRTSHFLDLKLASFPLNLAISGDSTPSEKPVDISIKADSLSMNILSPFIPVVSDIDGFLDMNITAQGKDMEHLNYFGNLSIPDFNFLLDINNLRYYGRMNIDFDRSKILISNTNLRNDPNDLQNSSANINGEVLLNGFDLRSYDFSVSTDALMVLNAASAKALPAIVGKLVIATGERPISVKGNLSHLNMKGDINLLNGSLTMKGGTASNSVESKMQYKVLRKGENENDLIYNVIDNALGDTLYSEINSIKDTVKTETKEYSKSGSIGSNMFINMNFRILNPITLRMDLGGVGNLFAKIGLENQYYPLTLNYSPNGGLTVTGDIKLLQGSKLSYIKQFEAEGTISFPLGTVSNPMLNLRASHYGRSYIQDVMREYKVFMFINGNLSQPSIRFDYEFANETAKGDSTQVFQDALALIIFGRTKTEMEMGMRANSTEYGNMGMGMLTQRFSDFLSGMLQGTGSIESVEIDMGKGNRFDDARLRATGRLFDRIGWRYGSDLNDLSQNAEFSLEVPMNIILDSNYLNNIVWQFSTSSNVQQTAINRNQKDWEIKLRFGGNW